ncbi:MAG: hypothetical protein LH606_02430 [Cytophagaceae bacterium]|nr:hypothetical protein [Cytophagaceae bacterium]
MRSRRWATKGIAFGPGAGLFGVFVLELMPDEPATRVAEPEQMPVPSANPASLTPGAETHYQELISALKESNRVNDALLPPAGAHSVP